MEIAAEKAHVMNLKASALVAKAFGEMAVNVSFFKYLIKICNKRYFFADSHKLSR